MESTDAGMWLPELGKSQFRGQRSEEQGRYAQAAHTQKGWDETQLGFHILSLALSRPSLIIVIITIMTKTQKNSLL